MKTAEIFTANGNFIKSVPADAVIYDAPMSAQTFVYKDGNLVASVPGTCIVILMEKPK